MRFHNLLKNTLKPISFTRLQLFSALSTFLVNANCVDRQLQRRLRWTSNFRMAIKCSSIWAEMNYPVKLVFRHFIHSLPNPTNFITSKNFTLAGGSTIAAFFAYLAFVLLCAVLTSGVSFCFTEKLESERKSTKVFRMQTSILKTKLKCSFLGFEEILTVILLLRVRCVQILFQAVWLFCCSGCLISR